MRVGKQVVLQADLYETLLDDFPDIVHSVDENGMIVFTNKKAETLLGYSREELLSMSVRDIYAPEVLRDVDTGFSKLKDEGTMSVESILLHASRLAAIGEMAAGIAHDINNPLTVVMVSLQMSESAMDDGKSSLPEGTAQVPLLLHEAGRGAAVIQELSQRLLTFSRDMADEQTCVDLRDIIDDSLFLTQNRIKMGSFVLEDTIPRGEHFTTCAHNQIQRVFVNLIGNAADAMSGTEGGSLKLVVSPVVRSKTKYWKCDVSDAGPGIPEDDLARVFDSFFTTKGREGNGLGLSISRGIISEHEGMVELESEVGVGTTFSVYLRQAEGK